MKMLRAFGVAVTLCALVVGTGCTKDKKGEQTDENAAPSDKKKAAKLVAPDFFKRIPADSPFVYASYEAWDETFVSKMGDMMTPLIDIAKADIDDPEAEEFFREFGEVFSIAGMKKIGVDVTPRMALYISGASLVWRMEIADGDTLKAFVDTLIKKYADEPIESKTLGTVRYWESPPDELAVVFGIDKREFVMAVMPSTLKSGLLPAIFGDQMPAQSIVDTGALAEVVAAYGGAKGAGYLDTRALLLSLTQPSKGLEGTPLDQSSMSAVCKEEFASLAGIMPRMVFGYGELNATKMSMYYGVELRKDIAKKLSEVARPVPGYSVVAKNPGVMSFGMGLNVAALISWGNELSATVAASPYRCEEFDEINEAFASLPGVLSMAPAMVGDIGGFVMSLDSFDPLSPTSVSGVMAVASKEPGPLLSLLGNFVPGLRGLKLETGGAPQKIDLAEMGVPVVVHAAKGKTMLGFSAGNSSSARLTELVASGSSQGGPFFSMIYDYSMLASLIEKDQRDENSEKTKAMSALLRSFGILRFEMEANAKGVLGSYDFGMR